MKAKLAKAFSRFREHTSPRVAGRLLITSFGFASAVHAATLTFQNGFAGYASTVDTFLMQSQPATSFGNSQAVEWDGDEPSGTGRDVIALIRFDDLIGTNGSQIPPGAQITSAHLSYVVSNLGSDGQVHEPLVSWSESTTYDSFGDNGMPGVQPDEYGPSLGYIPGGIGVRQLNVTTSVQAWARGAANRGWIILPVASDGVQLRSSEYTTVLFQRPKLTVVINEGPPTPSAQRSAYVQKVTPTSAVVCWRTDLATNGLLQVGSSPADLNRQVVDFTESRSHCLEVAGLEPATRYAYAAGSTARPLAGSGDEYFFTTAPAFGSTAPFTAWIIGDSGTANTDQAAVRDAMLAYTAGSPPDLILHLGDVAYNDGTEGEFTEKFFAPYAAILRHTVLWPTFGNHEGHTASSATQSGPYYEAFVTPTKAQAGGLRSCTEAYYSFDWGLVHFVSLGSYDVDRAPGAPLLKWLAADLATTNRPWIVAFFHHPPYTKGSHDSDNVSDSAGAMRDMRANVLPILEAGGVDLVLSGHSHTYERSYLVDGAYDTPTTAAGHILDAGSGRPAQSGPYLKPGGNAPRAGTVYVVAGHGGTTNSGTGGHPLMFTHELVHGSCLMSVDRNVLSLENLRKTGVVSDNFAIVKGAYGGDCDADGALDLPDWATFADCLAGPASAPEFLGCRCADLDQNGFIDLRDYAKLQTAFRD